MFVTVKMKKYIHTLICHLSIKLCGLELNREETLSVQDLKTYFNSSRGCRIYKDAFSSYNTHNSVLFSEVNTNW